MNDIIMVTDWEKVEKDDFYLTEEWEDEAGKDVLKRARKLQKEGRLYIAYEVPAASYALYAQMDATQVFIDNDGNPIMACEGEVIGNEHKQKWES